VLRRTAVVVVGLTLLVGCGPHRTVTPAAPDTDLVGSANALDRRIESTGLAFADERLERHLTETAARVVPTQTVPLRVRVSRDHTPNAIALPNGTIWINAGLFPRFGNDAQLALVIAHEAAHLRRGDITAGLQERQNTRVVTQVAGIVLAPLALADATSGGFYSMLVAGYGRDREHAADADAFQQVAAAGYPVDGIPSFFDALDAVDTGTTDSIYADHPANARRKAALQALVSSAPRPTTHAGLDRQAFHALMRPVVAESVRLCLESGATQRALAEADATLRVDPDQPRVHALRGDAIFQLDDPNDAAKIADAVAAYERDLALDPSVAEAHRGLGYVAVARKDRATARTELAAYRAGAPRAPDRRYVQSLIVAQETP
jgi:predicted Zn-dependent protease